MVAATLLTAGSDLNGGTSAVTASVAPAAGALVLVAVMNSSENGGAQQGGPSGISGAGLTFTKVSEVNLPNTWDTLSLWRALSATPGSGALTISFANQQDAMAWSVVEFSGVDQSGVNGAGAVVQAATNTGGNSNTLTATLGAFSGAGNGTYSAHASALEQNVTPPTATPGAGFTELHEATIDDPLYAMTLQTQWKATNDTTAEVTWSRVMEDLAAIAIEIKESGGQNKTLGLDSAIQKAFATNVTSGAAVQKRLERSASADSALRKAFSVLVTADSALRKLLTKAATLSAVLFSESLRSVFVDAALQVARVRQATMDANIQLVAMLNKEVSLSAALSDSPWWRGDIPDENSFSKEGETSGTWNEEDSSSGSWT